MPSISQWLKKRLIYMMHFSVAIKTEYIRTTDRAFYCEFTLKAHCSNPNLTHSVFGIISEIIIF